MKGILQKCMAAALCLTIFTGQACALTAAERFTQAASLINTRGLIAETKPISPQTIAEKQADLEKNPADLSKVLNAILSQMDTHSMYLTASEYQAGFAALSGYAGVGISISQKDDGIFVQQVMKRSPAARAGIQAGDRLTAIDGKSIEGMPLRQVGALLQGELGSRVELAIVRAGQVRKFSLNRETILEDNIASREAAPGIAYIAIRAFSSYNDVEDFAEIWNHLDEKQTKAVILDLRDNGGGVVDAAIAMLNLMLEKPGEMVTMHYRADAGGDLVYESEGGGLPLNRLVVLVNKNTASAAEMMAGVLHETGGATLIGAQTYGKAQGQYHLQLDGDYLILTCMEMHLPHGGSWEGVGLEPDITSAPQRTIDAGLQAASALDLTRPVAPGQKGMQAQAVNQRLHLLGYLAKPTDVMDADAVRALGQFEQDVGLKVHKTADPETLRMLDTVCMRAAAQGLMIDDVYYEAVALCQTAVRQPLRYHTQTDGTWRAA